MSTFHELGYPSIVGETWFTVFAPAGTPKPDITRLGAALKTITTSEAMGEAMGKIGIEAKSSANPGDLLAVTQQQNKLWGDMVKRLDMKPE